MGIDKAGLDLERKDSIESFSLPKDTFDAVHREESPRGEVEHFYEEHHQAMGSHSDGSPEKNFYEEHHQVMRSADDSPEENSSSEVRIMDMKEPASIPQPGPPRSVETRIVSMKGGSCSPSPREEEEEREDNFTLPADADDAERVGE